MVLCLRMAVALAFLVAGYGDAVAACGPLLPTKEAGSMVQRAISAQDLIELRDIGSPDSSSFGMPSRLAVSPDGRQVAFSLLRADLVSNSYCLGLFVSPIKPDAEPREVNAGGELIPETDNLRGFSVPSGGHAAIVPSWSPDGRRLAFLRRDQGVTQLWVVDADGGRGHAATHLQTDVTAFQWSTDGRRLIFATRPAVAEARVAIAREGETGWLYDRRILPPFSSAPLIAADLPRSIFSIGVDGGPVSPASAADTAKMPAEGLPGIPPLAVAMSADGSRATTEPNGTSLLAPRSLIITRANGRTWSCNAIWCRDAITGLWWAPYGDTLLVLHREGWNKEEMAIYRWTAGISPQVVFRTKDDLQDCTLAKQSLVCTRENATTPRRIVRIDLRRGTARNIFDPNPAFAHIALGQVRRLKARNSLGLESWADLVLPPTYHRGDKLPLVIVQYHSNGFLRGGTGDEYPIHLLAARGFAVLSFERPPTFALAFPNVRSALELNALNLKDWTERRSILSSLLVHVDQAIATGMIDPTRIGITGQSDGASTVQFALLNSNRFAAAAISSCCFEPRSVTVSDGIAFSDFIQKAGFPGSTRDDPDFWRANSFVVSGKKVRTPLLMQLADREYLSALDSFEALREYGKPVEMFVFPDEYHVKRQPRHRLAIYQRNIDWFLFWLQRRSVHDPAKASQFARWEAMRDAAMKRASP